MVILWGFTRKIIKNRCLQYALLIKIHLYLKLPSGKYLCINAKEIELEKAQNTLIDIEKEKFNNEVKFIIKLIILKGILS